MKQPSSMVGHLRTLLLKYLCLLPFAVSLLVPVGTMPTVSSDGTFTLVICTGHGPEERTFPAPDGEQEDASAWCPFSLLSAAVILPAELEQGRIAHRTVVSAWLIDLHVPATTDLASFRPRGPPLLL